MELRHLRYFIAVAEELNFSRAAARLHVSQPPLSRQIRGLEAELKVKLLDRNTQGVRLTRAGHAVLARSRKLVCDAEALRARRRRLTRRVRRSFGLVMLPRRQLSSYPECSPDIMSCHPEQALASTILPTLRCCRG
jgi:DNA-binding transcriptional LysR family regulator